MQLPMWYFNNPTADQSLQCNGTSNFYRIEIDKGIDQTYVLNIDANNPANFNLFGRNNLQREPPVPNAPDAPNPNALGLLAGTVRLGPNIVLPSLCEDVNYPYNLDLDAQIWLDGGTIHMSTTTGRYLAIYGKMKLTNNGVFDIASGIKGIIMREQGVLELQSGTINSKVLRTSAINGIHRGAIIMSGGTINLSGPDDRGEYASFTLPYPDNVFRMSGGTINIDSPTRSAGPGDSFSILIGSDPRNVSVTGGTVNITVLTNRNSYINSTAPFWNVNITSTSSTYRAQILNYAGNAGPYLPAIAAQPLIVYHNLNIQNAAVFNANGSDLTVGHDFVINAAAEYESGNNTTTFDGNGGQRFTNSGVVNNGTGLYNLVISGSSNTDIFSNDLIARGSLDIGTGCFLNDYGHTIRVTGNITNSGTHTSQANGGIVLNGATSQTIGGSGEGIFGNLVINKSGGTASLTANQSLTGNLRLANGLLNIGIYNLHLGAGSNVYDALTGTSTTLLSGTKMIRTSGNQSDGGVTKDFNSTNPFVFPIGTAGDYTPATIQFTQIPATWGNVTVKPVAEDHPFITSANSLNYYWKVISNGFSGIPAGSCI